jgi:hypothetical protein
LHSKFSLLPASTGFLFGSLSNLKSPFKMLWPLWTTQHYNLKDYTVQIVQHSALNTDDSSFTLCGWKGNIQDRTVFPNVLLWLHSPEMFQLLWNAFRCLINNNAWCYAYTVGSCANRM